MSTELKKLPEEMTDAELLAAYDAARDTMVSMSQHADGLIRELDRLDMEIFVKKKRDYVHLLRQELLRRLEDGSVRLKPSKAGIPVEDLGRPPIEHVPALRA